MLLASVSNRLTAARFAFAPTYTIFFSRGLYDAATRFTEWNSFTVQLRVSASSASSAQLATELDTIPSTVVPPLTITLLLSEATIAEVMVSQGKRYSVASSPVSALAKVHEAGWSLLAPLPPHAHTLPLMNDNALKSADPLTLVLVHSPVVDGADDG